MCSIVSTDHEKGFILINMGLFIVGMLIWLGVVRNNSFAIIPVWVLTILEFINGTGHSLWAIIERDYVPGVATAPILFILAIYLIRQLTKTNRTVVHRSG